jgi:RNA polymerase sigma factor (sigma-70 family)
MMLLKGGIMAQPLKKTRKKDGSLYHRRDDIEVAIDVALTQDLTTQSKRALIRDYAAPDYLPSEVLLHLIRDARRRDDETAFNALLPLLLARCEANLNAHVASTIRAAAVLRRDILGDFAELIAIDGTAEDTHKLDYYEVNFNGAFAAFRKTRVRDELGFHKLHQPIPDTKEGESVEHELGDEFIARLADFHGDNSNPEERIFRKQVLAAIRQLPREEQIAIVLVHHYGYTREAAARLCDVTERTIRNRLDRAYETLRKLKEDK